MIAGVQGKFVNYEGKDPLGFVIKRNLRRMHYNESQRAMVAAKIANLKDGQRKDLTISKGRPNGLAATSQTDAADMLNVGKRTVKRAVSVRNYGVPELIQAVESGTVKVSPAAVVATLPKEEQAEVVAKGEKEILKKAAEIREAKREALRIANQAKAQIPVPKVDGEYDVIIVDPPWPMKRIERDLRPNQAEDVDYPTMELEQIRELEIPAAQDCHLWLWTTHKFLPDALRDPYSTLGNGPGWGPPCRPVLGIHIKGPLKALSCAGWLTPDL